MQFEEKDKKLNNRGSEKYTPCSVRCYFQVLTLNVNFTDKLHLDRFLTENNIHLKKSFTGILALHFVRD